MTAQSVVPVELATGGPRGLRSFIVTGDHPFLVDTGVPGSAPMILAGLERAGLVPSDIELIVITHAHVDHAGSAAELAQATGAPLLAHETDAARIAAGATEAVVGRTPAGRAAAEQIAARRAAMPEGPAYAPVEVAETFSDARDLSDLGIDANVIHTPGHTPGGLTVLLGNGEAIVGDLIGSEDGEPSLAFFASDENAITESIRAVMSFEPTAVHTSHDGSFDAASLAEAFGYLA